MAAPQSLRSVGVIAAGVVAAVVGVVIATAIGRYCGYMVVIPVALVIFLGAPIMFLSVGPVEYRGALVVQLAHVLWMAAGAAFTGEWSIVAIDLCVLSAGLVWLLVNPGVGPAVFLLLYQLAGTTINLFTLIGVEAGSLLHRALVMHLFLRAVSIIFLFTGCITFTKPGRQGDLGGRFGEVEETISGDQANSESGR